MLGIVTHPDCLLHDAGPGHPDVATRIDAISNQIIASGIDFVARHYDAPMVTRDQLRRVHGSDYVDRILALEPRGGIVQIDGDTVVSDGTLPAAQRAAGAGVLGVDLVMKGDACPVFCAVRPPGHHAEHNRAMGFCLFNNVAIAAAHALEAHGLERVAILDFDAHHGNGTEDIFRDDPRVLFCSSFQHPFYPFTGHPAQSANLVDVPLPAGTGGAEFRAAIMDRWMPALEAFAPEFVLVSAGFDAHVLDDMSSLALVEADYELVTEQIVRIARRHAEGRIVSVLEGGYETGALARSVVAHLRPMVA